MEMNNVVCPVCTLYLRPGITLKSHLTSHPKHKVIEALVRLSSADIQNLEPVTEAPESNSNTNNNSVGNTQLNTSAVNQTWNQDNCAATTTTPTPGMQGNHVFIYQQSMSTSGPQPNVLNVNPMSQQYVIPTVLNPQMMPYVYQQQQVIMSSGSCIPQMRVLPFELANDTTDHSSNSGSESHPCIEEVEIEKTQSKLIEIAELEPSNSQKSFEDNLEDDKLDSSKPEKIEDKGYKVENEAVLNMGTRYEVNHETPSCSDWNTSSEQHDLNKACQTQNVVNVSPRSSEHEPEIIENLDKKYYYFNETENSSTYHSKEHMNNIVYDQPEPIYSTANILESNEHLDFVDMDGMHVIIGDFATNPIISQVENYEVNRADRSGILMNIGGMMDSQKETFNGHAEIEESMSRGSTMVNMRTDERMPPRGELSGQESIGDTSDMNWSRLHYNEGSSARESWEASDVSDVDEPPMDHQVQLAAEPDDNDVPSVVGYIAPPLNFKCSLCGEAFPCLQDRKEHDLEQHPDKLKSTLVGGKIAGQRKVKKLVVKLKSETENFDVVFTNKIKVETNNETKTTDDDQILATELKTDENITVDSRTVCSLCNCVMSDVKALREHKLEVHKISPDLRFKCSTCDESFPNEYKYTEHLKVHPLECRLCGKLFYRRQNMQLHMKRHLGIKPYKCEICEKAFLTKQKLEEHRNTHTGNSPIKCTLCDETFRRHSNLVQHRNRHHLKLKKKVKDYVCYCGEYFHSKKKLAWHKETHDPKPKACTKCSEKFIHLSSLTRHMRRAHNERFLPKEERSNENVECPICKGVYLRSSLDVHIRNHSGLRPFSCLICNKDFTTRWNLKLHKWTHASRVSKPFKCDQCKGAFIRESDYTAHMNSHKSIRPYTCNYCGAQFIRKYNCQRHVKEHENVKTFNCQVCGKSFHRSYYLKDHMRVHSGIRPFTCHVCGKTSTTKSNHNKHVQIHHAREPVSTEN